MRETMLDQGVSLRSVLVWVASVVAMSTTAAGWIADIEELQGLGLVLTIIACTLVLAHDHAKTRQLLRRNHREAWERATGNRITRVP